MSNPEAARFTGRGLGFTLEIKHRIMRVFKVEDTQSPTRSASTHFMNYPEF